MPQIYEKKSTHHPTSIIFCENYDYFPLFPLLGNNQLTQHFLVSFFKRRGVGGINPAVVFFQGVQQFCYQQPLLTVATLYLFLRKTVAHDHISLIQS